MKVSRIPFSGLVSVKSTAVMVQCTKYELLSRSTAGNPVLTLVVAPQATVMECEVAIVRLDWGFPCPGAPGGYHSIVQSSPIVTFERLSPNLFSILSIIGVLGLCQSTKRSVGSRLAEGAFTVTVAWCGPSSARHTGDIPHGLRILQAWTPEDAALWTEVLRTLESAAGPEAGGEA